MFGLKRTRDGRSGETSIDTATSLDRVDQLNSRNQPLSAVEAFAQVRPLGERYGGDARMYLVLGTDVAPSGLAPSWEFHYIYPERHAEGRFTARTASASSSDRAELHSVLTPFPQPGTPEDVMRQNGGYMLHLVEQAWQARLERILGLPVEFHDSIEAVEEMERSGHPLFSGGPLRMKGRTLPSGHAVWEAITTIEVIHTPFGLGRG